MIVKVADFGMCVCHYSISCLCLCQCELSMSISCLCLFPWSLLCLCASLHSVGLSKQTNRQYLQSRVGSPGYVGNIPFS